MKKIIDYVVIVDSKLSGLEERVLENIKLGWQPFGSIMHRPGGWAHPEMPRGGQGGWGGGGGHYGQSYSSDFYSIQLVKYED